MNASNTRNEHVEVLVVGGGPTGLSAALTLGRARRKVVLVDGGERRNQRATEVHTFLSRDGTPPDELRRLCHEELRAYPTVSILGERLTQITGHAGAFVATTESGSVTASRVLLAAGMVDERLPIEGFDALWGTSIVHCPYCHGFEQRDERFGVLVTMPAMADMAHLLLNWTARVTAFLMPGVVIEASAAERLERRGVVIERAPIARLVGDGGHLRSVVLEGGREVGCDLLFARPPQRQTDLVRSLDLALDDHGFVKVDDKRATSRPGIYAAGDLTTMMQSAIGGAASGNVTAAMIVHELSLAH